MRGKVTVFLLVALIGATVLTGAVQGTTPSDAFTQQANLECTDDDLLVQTGIANINDCFVKCMSIGKCFSGVFVGGQCKLKAGYCKATKASSGATTFTRQGYRRCFICRSASLCPISTRTCYTLGKCSKNNGENGVWQQSCDCDPAQANCCDADYCNCVGEQCSKVNQTTARVPYSDVYRIYSMWHRKVHQGKGRAAFGGGAPKFGGAPKWGAAGGKPAWGGGGGWGG